MKIFGKSILSAGLAALVVLSVSTNVFAEPLGQITSYDIPSGGGAYGVVQGPDGNFWITQNVEEKIWKFDPDAVNQNDQFTSYDISQGAAHITSGPDNAVWYSFTGKSSIGKVKMNGMVSEHPLPETTVNGRAYNYAARGLTMGPDGRIWILAQPAAPDYPVESKIFRMNSNGTIYKQHSIGGDEPVNIAADHQNGVLWYTTRVHYGANTTDKIGRIDLQGSVQEWDVPASMGSLWGITIGPDGNTWFSGGAYFATIDANGNFSQLHQLPGGVGIRQLKTGLDGYLWATASNKVARIDTSSPQNAYMSNSMPSANNFGMAAGSDGNMWFADYGNNNIGKIGTGVGGSVTDFDDDGLTAAQELTQGTSDLVDDTDGDGLSDFGESQWNPNRDSVFCGLGCAYPDPLQKNLYVELDWMEKPGEYSMKPTHQQLEPVIGAFADKGISLRFDRGEYGGGNEVPYNSSIWFTSVPGERDFIDYKRGTEDITVPQFDSQRDGIWHYTISGDHWKTEDGNGNLITGSSGVANVGGPNAFVAYKRLETIAADANIDFDTAVSGTTIHELGHNLCLTGSQLSTTPTGCFFIGIDNDSLGQAYEAYESSMNYMYQLTRVGYSQNVSNSQYDHDDWSGLRLGEFTMFSENQNGQAENPSAKDKKKNKNVKNFKHAISAEYAEKKKDSR